MAMAVVETDEVGWVSSDKIIICDTYGGVWAVDGWKGYGVDGWMMRWLTVVVSGGMARDGGGWKDSSELLKNEKCFGRKRVMRP